MNIKNILKRREKDGTRRGHALGEVFGILLLMAFMYLTLIIISYLPIIQKPIRDFLINLLFGPVGIFFIVAYVLFFVLTIISNFFVLHKDEIMNQGLIFIGISFFVFLSFAWMGKMPLTKSGFLLEKEHLDIFLTFILVFATIVNINIFRKQLGVNRLTSLNHDLTNKLDIHIENDGKFIAKSTILSLCIIKMKKIEKIENAKDRVFRKRLFSSRDFFFPKIFTNGKIKSIKDYIEVELGIKINQEMRDFIDGSGSGQQPCFKPKKKAGSYILYTKVDYKSDLGARCPYSIVKYYKIEMLKDGRFSINEIE